MTSPTTPPIVIAVSGHRALHAGDGARLRVQLSAALEQVAQLAPLDCLSALAAGADQLFAEQVLALQERLGIEGVRLRVPLPMPEAAYIASQEEPGSAAFRDSYLALRARAQAVFEVPADGGDFDGAAPYVRLGDYFAAHAGLLVALWDGDTGAQRQPGGTFDVVMRCLARPGRAVLHLPARRAASLAAAVPAMPAMPAMLSLDDEGRLQRDEDPAALARCLAGLFKLS
jgi:hypothetical protein